MKVHGGKVCLRFENYTMLSCSHFFEKLEFCFNAIGLAHFMGQ
jgi:hypothetical protein